MQNSDPISTLSASRQIFNYAAPELFAPQNQSDSPSEDHEVLVRRTTQTDIYAFGSLYYAVCSNYSSAHQVRLATTCTDILWFCSVFEAK
jgi:hypothetical protein